MRTWQKTMAVLVRAISPQLFERWSKGNPANLWNRPFVVYVEHPAWSAQIITEAGASENAIWLVAYHQESADQWDNHSLVSSLRRLQRADNSN
jgi:hypothetical protein